MLGDLIGEERGKRGVRRVLEVDGEAKVEVSFEADGKILGIDEHSIVTYTSTVRPDGSLYGEGNGVVLAANGAAGSWVGAGAGKFGEGGSVSYRGAVYFYSTAQQWSRLNSIAIVFEFEVDGQGNTHSKLWEWK